MLGNDDHFTDPVIVTEHLENNGISVLGNRSISIERDGARFWLAGVDDVMAQADNLTRTLSGVPPDEPAVVLVHKPDIADTVVHFPVDLHLSGHSHGVNCESPSWGARAACLGTQVSIPVAAIRAHVIYTNNRGIGMTTIPMRFDCTPEITFITLKGVA